jgi:hypothetical protein
MLHICDSCWGVPSSNSIVLGDGWRRLGVTPLIKDEGVPRSCYGSIAALRNLFKNVHNTRFRIYYLPRSLFISTMTQQSYLLTLLFFVTLAPFVNGQSSTSTTFDPQSATVTIASFPPFTSEPYTCVRECLDHGGDNDLLYTMGCGPGAVNSCYCQLTSGALYTSRPFSIISGCIYDWCGQSHATESSATTEVSYAQSVYLAYCTQALNVAAGQNSQFFSEAVY